MGAGKGWGSGRWGEGIRGWGGYGGKKDGGVGSTVEEGVPVGLEARVKGNARQWGEGKRGTGRTPLVCYHIGGG